MKYYLLNWQEEGNLLPRIRDWTKRLDYQAVRKKELEKLPERVVLFLEENPEVLLSDIIEKPFFLVSKMFWEVSKMYEVRIYGKEVVLLDGINGYAEIYYLPVFPSHTCLSSLSVFNNDSSVLHKIVLDKEKLQYAPPIFSIEGIEKTYLVGRMDFVESILRRGAKGIHLTELEIG